MNTQAAAVMSQIHAALEPGEKLVALCNFAGTTGALTNRYVRFIRFKWNWLGKNPTIVANSSVPIGKISAIAESAEKQGSFGPKVYQITFWWEGNRANLVTTMLDEGKSFATKLRQHTASRPQSTPNGLAAELRELAALASDGIITNDEFTRAKEAFLGTPKDGQDEAVRLLRNLHDLMRKGIVSEGEFNMKKWDILTKRQMS